MFLRWILLCLCLSIAGAGQANTKTKKRSLKAKKLTRGQLKGFTKTLNLEPKVNTYRAGYRLPNKMYVIIDDASVYLTHEGKVAAKLQMDWICDPFDASYTCSDGEKLSSKLTHDGNVWILESSGFRRVDQVDEHFEDAYINFYRLNLPSPSAKAGFTRLHRAVWRRRAEQVLCLAPVDSECDPAAVFGKCVSAEKRSYTLQPGGNVTVKKTTSVRLVRKKSSLKKAQRVAATTGGRLLTVADIKAKCRKTKRRKTVSSMNLIKPAPTPKRAPTK